MRVIPTYDGEGRNATVKFQVAFQTRKQKQKHKWSIATDKWYIYNVEIYDIVAT